MEQSNSLVYENKHYMAFRSSKIDGQYAKFLVEDILSKNLEKSPKAEDVADCLCVSVRTLSRRLKNANLSYRRLLDGVREEKCSDYLLRTDLSMEEIAATVGYSDTSNFIKAFKRWKGCTPRAYRRNHFCVVQN